MKSQNIVIVIIICFISPQTYTSEIHTKTNQTTHIKLRPHTPKIGKRLSLSQNEQKLFELVKTYPTPDTKKKIVTLLEKNNVNINVQDHLGHTPLHKAVLYATGPLYSFLVSLGAREDIYSYKRNVFCLMGMHDVPYTYTISEKTPRELIECSMYTIPNGQMHR